MTKIVAALVVVIAAVGLFFYVQQAEAPVSNQEIPTQGDSMQGDAVFGEGADIVGNLETTGTPDGMSGASSTPEGTEPATAPSGEQTSGVISRADLAKHKTQGDCWIAYKGVVYDITAWLPRHPGSAQAIAPYCGTAEEFAAAFNRQHGTSKDGRLKREGVEEGTLGN